MKTKLTKKFWVALTLFSLIGQIAWVVENMYLNVFMYKMFHASAGDISTMVAAERSSSAADTYCGVSPFWDSPCSARI